MYLAPYETKWCAAVRCMDRPTRAAKIVEIHKQLTWLNATLAESGSVDGMVQGELSLADFTWFPTIIFMEFMLPRVFDWPDVFNDGDEFPALRAWFVAMKARPEFASVHADIWDFWVQKHEEGQFDSIREEVEDKSFKWHLDELRA